MKCTKSTEGSEFNRFLQLLKPILGSPDTSITLSLSLIAFISITDLLFCSVNSSDPGSTSIFNEIIPALSKGKVSTTVSPIVIERDCLLSLFIFIETKALGTSEEVSSTLILIIISSPTIPNLGADSIINLLSFSFSSPESKKFIGALKL